MMMDFITTVPALAILAALAVVIGGIFLSRGLLTRKKIKGCVRISAHTKQVGNGLGGGITWTWQGEEFSSAIPYFYSFTPGEEISIFIKPSTGQFYLNVWTHNGKLDLLVSTVSFACGIILAIFSSMSMMA